MSTIIFLNGLNLTLHDYDDPSVYHISNAEELNHLNNNGGGGN